MSCIHSLKKKIAVVLSALLVATNLLGQTTPQANAPVTSSYNQLATLLVIMTVVLAFVLWGLGQVLVVLSRQVLEKNKNVAKILTAVLTIALLFAGSSAMAQGNTTGQAAKELPNYGGLSSTTFYMFVTVIITEVLAILFMAFSIRRVYMELLPAKDLAAAKKSALKEWWAGLDKKIFTRAIPVEKEADVLLDHNYDGIQELDNALPPWWKYGFYITIVVAFVYLLNFHVFGTGKNPTEEYAAEMEKAKIEKEIYDANNKDKVDENHVPMADAAGLDWAKGVFTTRCKACHGEQGQGLPGLGPNLTDDYWLHKGSLNDIFHSITNGYPDKGMQSWATEYTPKQISFLASYVKSIHGTNPPGAKPPQGDLFVDAPSTTAAGDSAKKITTDTTTAAVQLVNKPDSAKAVPKK